MNTRIFAQAFIVAVVVMACCLGMPVRGESQVQYQVVGVLSQTPDGPFLYVDDGRVLRLLFKTDPDHFGLGFNHDPSKQFEGKLVDVIGRSLAQGASIDRLEVKSIRLHDVTTDSQEPVPYKDHMRSPRMIESSPSEIRLSDVRWGFSQKEGQEPIFHWETTTIRPDLLDRVFLCMKPFAPKFLAGHAFFLFTFKEGGLVDGKGKASQGLVLSIEAYLKKGEQYSMKNGFRNAYPIVWILATWEDYSAMQCGVPGKTDNELFPYPIKLGQEKNIELLKETLRHATANRNGEMYDLIRNNCTNNLVLLLNRVTPPEMQVNPWILPRTFYNPQATVPVLVPRTLMKKGILGSPGTTITGENFFAPFDKVVSRNLSSEDL